MNKTTKVILAVATGALIVFVGSSLEVKKNNIFSPATKSPTTINFQEASNGCANVFVYKTNSDNTTGISVSAQSEKLNLSATEKIFEVGKTDGLDVEILIGQQIERLYCNDLLYRDQPRPRKLIGKSGQAVISVSEPDKSQPEWDGSFMTTVILRDLRFVDEKGKDVGIIVGKLIFRNVRVGWYAG